MRILHDKTQNDGSTDCYIGNFEIQNKQFSTYKNCPKFRKADCFTIRKLVFFNLLINKRIKSVSFPLFKRACFELQKSLF